MSSAREPARKAIAFSGPSPTGGVTGALVSERDGRRLQTAGFRNGDKHCGIARIPDLESVAGSL